METPCTNCSDFFPLTPNPCMNDECEYKRMRELLIKLSVKLPEWYSKCDEYCTREMKNFESEIDAFFIKQN